MDKKTKQAKRMKPETKSILFLAIALVLTLAVGIIAITGLNLDSRGLYKLKPWVPSLNTASWPSAVPLGMDLGGGTYTEYQAALPEGSDTALDTAVDSTISVMNSRLYERGYVDAAISKTGDGKIRIELPKTSEKDRLLALLSSSGKLTFSFPDGTFLEGNDVKSALKDKDPKNANPVVNVTLNSKGTKELSTATTSHSGQDLTVALDGQTIYSITVQEPISNGQFVVSGFSSEQDARDMAITLRMGMLPVTLTESGAGDVAAKMGDGIAKIFVIGGLILLVLAAAYLVARYLLGGVAAALALWADVTVTYFLLAIFQATQITLLGLIGLVLGFALFVVTNAVLLDKFAQGLKPGRLHKGSAKEGWAEIRTQVWRIHGICIAVSFVLLILPIGFLKSFASTVLASTVSGLLVTWAGTRLALFHGARLLKNDPEKFARKS